MGRFFEKWFKKLWFGTRNTYFRRQLRYFLISGLIIFAIVNNGNILTDGHRYRKRPRIEM